MTGFFAATIGELITGKGALGQLALETNLPPGVVKVIIGLQVFAFQCCSITQGPFSSMSLLNVQ